MRKPRYYALLLALLIGVVTPTTQAHDPSLHGFNLVTFDKPLGAPEFELPQLAGGDAALESYRGRYVLLNFWATWCPPCLKEMPSMQVIHDRYATRNFTVVAVSSDEGGATDVQPFIDKLGVDFPILLDADGAVSATYGAKNLPMTFLLDPDGRVIAAAQGEREWDSEEALSTLDEMLPTE